MLENNQGNFPKNAMFGHAYVMNQVLRKTFSPEESLKKGTIFPELVSPYVPCQDIEEMEYIKQTNLIGEGCNKC